MHLQVTAAAGTVPSSAVKMECDDAPAPAKADPAPQSAVKAEPAAGAAPPSAAKENVAPLQTPVNKLLGRAQQQAPGSGPSPSEQ